MTINEIHKVLYSTRDNLALVVLFDAADQSPTAGEIASGSIEYLVENYGDYKITRVGLKEYLPGTPGYYFDVEV